MARPPSWRRVSRCSSASFCSAASVYGFDDPAINKGLDTDIAGYTGAEKRTLKLKVNAPSTKAGAKVSLKDLQVALAPGFSGDLTVTVGGTAGLSGEVKVAEVVAPVSM
ncbi:MAG: hypothetical protein QHH27_11340, partial [Clostridia bacterium]|nr:hypothetical protein [Clostridia bacterium]